MRKSGGDDRLGPSFFNVKEREGRDIRKKRGKKKKKGQNFGKGTEKKGRFEKKKEKFRGSKPEGIPSTKGKGKNP